ncbi:MAG: hypothetical protein KFB96_20590 [Thiocapsa sp.]|uniref:hypothetical protein n=1 Tax=Thiocapsa sp. TaxID=2024551 RepID=UPI001BCC08A8|nr:hypothetical protein [Thiocapsa sp.]QVL48022.1 MAG: hypothetical protein KFB96_20590 [Thiocapsa sp.]
MYDIDLDRDYPDARLRSADRLRPDARPELRMQTWAELQWEAEQQKQFGPYARQIEADALRSLG